VIDQLDILLRKLITSSVAGFASDDQVRFQPPDDDWRTYVKTLSVGGQPANALNLYLVDLRENRKLRSNDKPRSIQNGDISETPMPRRLDCHYLISAWSPADVTPALEPALDEHAALYLVAASLARHDPLIPAAVYAPGPVPPGFPPELAAAELPIALVPPEGFIKLAEFWGTMGEKHRWKPTIYLIVTLPITTVSRPVGPAVTTTFTEIRATDAPAGGETRYQIGGTVWDSQAPPQPLPGCWIELLTAAGSRLQLVRADAAGRFTFVHLAAGAYRLRASMAGSGVVTRNITVPSPSGEYDLQL
jgi:Pvc16 N-terminal domain/Carboxypeptidase regulatory-like domain